MNNAKMVSFSIVVPTFNNCSALKDTINNLLRIDYGKYEIIIVNDGSTDGTFDYLNNLQNKNIRVINQKNQGVSSARNVGISVAKGDYILFVDDDDILFEDSLKILSKVAQKENPEVIKYTGYTQYLDGAEKLIKNMRQGTILSAKDSDTIREYLFCPSRKIDCYVWLLAIKNTKNIHLFNTKMKYLEDEMFYIENLLNDIKIVVIDNPLYRYTYNKSGKTKDTRKIYDNITDLAQSRQMLQRASGNNREIHKMITANIFKIMFARYRDAKRKISKNECVDLRKYLIKIMREKRIHINKYFSKTLIVKYILIKTRLY